jgi:large subunit GTPase 1
VGDFAIKHKFPGILPIDQMRDHYCPVQLLLDRVPHDYLQSFYSMPDCGGQAHDVLTALAFMKGYMSASGIPDCKK